MSFQLNKHKNIYFIGIGGVSMSGLAETLNYKGFAVSGSDAKDSELIHKLRQNGIDVHIGQCANNIPNDCDLAVYTAAVKEDNPEIMAAKSRNIEIIDRAELLGAIMDLYGYSVAVSGAHGKTTTTGMVSNILLEAGLDPTINVGGIFKGSNFRLGKSDYFVAESCEYFDSFLKFRPYIGIILNIDRDHTDYFKSMEQLVDSFAKFAGNIRREGCLIINTDAYEFLKVTGSAQCHIVTYGLKEGEFTAGNIVSAGEGTSSFDILRRGHFLCRVSLNVTGIHNIENALAAFAACYVLGVAPSSAAYGLSGFAGTKRRFEFKGSYNGIRVIDDYAHHPTEIAATLAAAKKYSHNKIYCIFQPHTYSRTKFLLDRFAGAFTDADTVILLDIYPARETDNLGVHSLDLAEKIRETGKEVYYFDNFASCAQFLQKNSIPRDMLITMGAGDVYLVGEMVLSTVLSTLSTDF